MLTLVSNLFITSNNLHNSTFPSLNLSRFTEENSSHNEDKRILNKKTGQNLFDLSSTKNLRF